MLPESGAPPEKIRYHWGWSGTDFSLWILVAASAIPHSLKPVPLRNIIRDRAFGRRLRDLQIILSKF
jgi:hypothetical protein